MKTKKKDTGKKRVRVNKLEVEDGVSTKLTASEAKKVKGGLAVDPRDSSGNTVYIAGASGGVWKTTDPKPISK